MVEANYRGDAPSDSGLEKLFIVSFHDSIELGEEARRHGILVVATEKVTGRGLATGQGGRRSNRE